MGRIRDFFGSVLDAACEGACGSLGGSAVSVAFDRDPPSAARHVGGCDATPSSVGGATVSMPVMRLVGSGPDLPLPAVIDPRLSHYELCVLRGLLQPYMNGPHWFGLSTIAAKLEAAAEHVAPAPLDVGTVPGIDLAKCDDQSFRRFVDDAHHDLRLAQQASMPLTLAEEAGDRFEAL